VKDDSAHDLGVESALSQGSARSFARKGERFGHELVEGFAFGGPFTELNRLRWEIFRFECHCPGFFFVDRVKGRQ